MKVPLRVLIVEHSENDAKLIIRQLKKAEYAVHHERVETAKEMKTALENQTWDIVISDYKLPKFNALAALAILQKTKLAIPFIVVSSTICEESAVELMKLGANDYLMIDKLVRLVPVVKRELAEAQVRQENKKSEETSRDRETQLSMIYNNVNDIIFTIAVESKDRFCFTSVNRRFLELTGLSEDQVVGKLVQDVIPKPSNILVLKKYREAIQTRQSVRWEEVSKYPTGEKIGEVTVSPIYDANGICTQLIGTVHDITERKQAEEELVKEQFLMNMLLDNVPDHIYFKDKESRFIRMNKSLATSFGLIDPAEAVGKSDFDFFSEQHARTAFEDEQKIINTGQPLIGIEEKETWPDGSETWVTTTKMPWRNRKGEVIGTFGISKDITKRKKAEEALQERDIQFNKLASQVPGMIYQFKQKPDGTFCVPFSSEGIRDVFGCSPQDVCDDFSPITKVILSEDLNNVIDSIKKSAEQLTPWQCEYRVKIPGQPIRWMYGQSVPERLNDGSIIWHGFNSDITERKKAEVELKESEERYKRLVEFSPDAIAVHSEGKIVYVNPATITLLGANNTSELIGKPFLDIIHPDYRDSVHQQIIAVMKENYAIPLTEQKFVRLNGSCIEVEVAAIPIVYKDKSAMQIVARDISKQKKLQNQLLQTQKIQSIGTLAGGIAHDFNNILGIILAYSSLLDKNVLTPEKFSVGISAINNAVQRGAALVRQILTFARKTDVVFEPMDVSELIHELLSMLDQTFPKTIIFSESITENLPFIFADRTQVHQALLNLCINARDAMPHGGTISITAEKQIKEQMAQQFPAANEEEYVCLTVTDTGKGMDEATRFRIFDPFFTTKEKGKGTGLGLSVVYGVVQEHHGFIDLKSEPDHGTTFRLFFPVLAVNKQAVNVQQPMESYEIGGTETILFVEDEELLIEMVSFLLESKGYTVLCARNGLEAVNVYQTNKQKIALVITDMGLPVMTGTDEFKKLKEINPNVKVVFASGYFELDIKSELLKDGANGFIQKPYEPDNILRVIRQVLDQKE